MLRSIAALRNRSPLPRLGRRRRRCHTASRALGHAAGRFAHRHLDEPAAWTAPRGGAWGSPSTGAAAALRHVEGTRSRRSSCSGARRSAACGRRCTSRRRRCPTTRARGLLGAPRLRHAQGDRVARELEQYLDNERDVQAMRLVASADDARPERRAALLRAAVGRPHTRARAPSISCCAPCSSTRPSRRPSAPRPWRCGCGSRPRCCSRRGTRDYIGLSVRTDMLHGHEVAARATGAASGCAPAARRRRRALDRRPVRRDRRAHRRAVHSRGERARTGRVRPARAAVPRQEQGEAGVAGRGSCRSASSRSSATRSRRGGRRRSGCCATSGRSATRSTGCCAGRRTRTRSRAGRSCCARRPTPRACARAAQARLAHRPARRARRLGRRAAGGARRAHDRGDRELGQQNRAGGARALGPRARAGRRRPRRVRARRRPRRGSTRSSARRRVAAALLTRRARDGMWDVSLPVNSAICARAMSPRACASPRPPFLLFA